jgi:hypothetical protein
MSSLNVTFIRLINLTPDKALSHGTLFFCLRPNRCKENGRVSTFGLLKSPDERKREYSDFNRRT